MDLFVKTLDNQWEMLTDFELTRKDSVNGDKTLNVSVIKTDKNAHSYELLSNENVFYYGNEPYVIKSVRERIVGNTVRTDCQAIHKMFDDLKNHYIYEEISGTKRINELLSFVLSDTFYFASVDDRDLPVSIQVQNFGDDNALSLFKNILDRFGAEFEVMDTYIYIAKQVGMDLDDLSIRYKLNVKNPQKEIDTSSFSTYIRGYGKQNEDGSYIAYQEYTSPLAEVYGIKHAPPVRDARYTNNNSLLERIKRELHDNIDISLSLTYVELTELGLTGHVHKGDYIWCILEPFNIKVKIRIIEIEDYSSPFKSPKLTIGTITRKATDVMASFNTTKKTVEKVVNTETNTIKRTALTEETNYVVDAIERSFDEIDYRDDISASDPANFMRRVGLRKGGIYRTTDGNYRYFVITPDGLDLTQVFGKLGAAHVEIGPETTFAPGYDPTEIDIPDFGLVSPTQDGLMRKEDYVKLANIDVDQEGNVVVDVPVATETENGLLESTDKEKLNQITISELGQVVDLSILVQKISDLEAANTDLTNQITDLIDRVTALEGGN